MIFLSALLCLTWGLSAQEAQTDSTATPKKPNKFVHAMNNVGDAFVKFDKETTLDSLDQENLPKLVTGGIFAGANMSDFLITHSHRTMASQRRIGAELGGFLDFALGKHFSIQPQVIFTAHQNYFAANDFVKGDTTNHLWSFGMEIPVYFLGRFGNMKQGYVQFGGGIFTHFTFASNIADKYHSSNTPPAPPVNPDPTPLDSLDFSSLYSLHNNHFGICAMVGYEFWFGMQINVTYKISLSDIAGFYSEKKGKPEANAYIYPQSLSLCIGYRFK